MNLLNAVRLAVSSSACGRGMLVALNQRVHAARDAQKGHIYVVEAFISPDAGPVGFVLDVQVQSQRAAQRTTAEDVLPMPLAGQWPWVEMLASYAQPDARVINALAAAGVKGPVIAAAGAGSVHANPEAALNHASQQGVSMLRSTHTGAGAVPAQPDAERRAASGSSDPYKTRMLLTLPLSSGRTQAEVVSLQQVIDRC